MDGHSDVRVDYTFA